MRTGRNRNTGLNNATADPEVDNEMISSQRIKARISTSAKLPGIEEALNNVVGSIGEQNEQMSIRMSELERAVHVERESLREEINRNRQEAGRSKKNA